MLDRSRQRAGRAYAVALKNSGAGAAATGTRTSFVGTSDIDWGGILGGVVEGVGQGLAGRARRWAEGGGGASGGRGSGTGIGGALAGALGQTCPEGTFNVLGRCVDLQPGGATQGAGLIATGGEAVMGAFGMPAMLPEMETRTVRSCGPGMVLGKDNLCYPKGILSRRSQYRKWRQPPRPPVTSSDVKAIRKAARAQDRVKELAKDVGLGRYTPRKKR